MLYPYPGSADAEVAVALVWSKLSGGQVTTAELVQAEWVLQGYAAKVGIPKILPAPVADPAAEAHAILHPQLSAHAIGDGKILQGIGAILNSPVAQKLLPILLQYLGGLAGVPTV